MQEADSVIEAVLNVRIPELWVTPVTEKHDAEVFCQIGGHSDKAGWGMVTIRGDDQELDKMVEEIKVHPSVGGVRIKDRQRGTVSLLVDVIRCRACRVLITSKAFMVYPVGIKKGRMKWLLITDDNRTVENSRRNLKKSAATSKLTE